jgi:hypothetical protein
MADSDAGFVAKATAVVGQTYQMYFGHPEVRALHVRMIKNVTLFAGACFLYKNYGDQMYR